MKLFKRFLHFLKKVTSCPYFFFKKIQLFFKVVVAAYPDSRYGVKRFFVRLRLCSVSVLTYRPWSYFLPRIDFWL